MMQSRSPMKRSQFSTRRAAPAKKELNRDQALALRAQRAIKNAPNCENVQYGKKAPPAQSVSALVATNFVAPQPKQKALRSEAYRRVVASLPCINCCINGYSQAAHPPPTAKGIKEDDRLCFPLCCARPGIHGCHYLFDQYKLLPREQMRPRADMWASQVRAVIAGLNLWPAGLPKYSRVVE